MTDIDAPTIAGFEVLKKLGQGGMSTVWMARQLSLDRIVAIKVLLPRFALDEEEVARFQSEAQAAARLKHGGIVQVYDTSVTDGSYYFIMEYIAGYTVGDWVRRKGVLPERDALLVAEHVSDALAYAWEYAKIIHCDIKPDNIMIDDDGTVKVTDLGLARTLNAMSSFIEEDGYVLGTPAYMSPEQARGDAHLDFRSDIYSLGAMLYHLVTGKRLFFESNDSETLELQIIGTAPDVMELNPSLSRPTCALIERMLAKNPDLRGESWQAVHADMRRAYSGIMPHHNLHDDDMSTMERCEHRSEIDHDRLRRLTSGSPHSRSSAVWTALWTAIAAVAIAIAVRFYISMSEQTAPPREPSRNQSQPPRQQSQNGTANSNTNGQRKATPKSLFDSALAWQRANPSDPDGAIERYESVVRRAKGTQYASRAEACIRMLRNESRLFREQTIETLRQQLSSLKETGEYTKAEALVAAYPGNQPEDIAFRERMLRDIDSHRKTRDSEQRQEERRRQEQLAKEVMTPIMKNAAKAIIQGNIELAVDLITPLRARDDLSWYHDSLGELLAELKVLQNADEFILETFRMQQGQTVEVQLDRGATLLTIGAFENGQIQCFQHSDMGDLREISLSAEALSQAERTMRLSMEYPSTAAIAKGVAAYHAGRNEEAGQLFRDVNFLIADALVELTESRMQHSY